MEDNHEDGSDGLSQRREPRWPAFLWHHKLHLAHEESLFYWRLAFAPTYDRDAVAAGLSAAAKRHGVRSLMSYEVFGAYDLLIRAWLPQDCAADHFHATLTTELAPAGLRTCDRFAVTDVARYWPFGDHDPGEPSDSDLNDLQGSEVLEIEDDFGGASPELRKRLERQSILSVYQPEPIATGIKFAVAINGSTDLDEVGAAQMTVDVERILDSADVIAERSLYAGLGFAHLIAMGKIPGNQFHALNTELISQFNVAAIREKYDLHTVTLISGQQGFHVAQEGLARAPEAGALDAPSNSESANGKEADEPEGMVFRRMGKTRTQFGRLLSGDIFAERFEVQEYLGGGGYAHVYRMRDREERIVRAIKIFPTEQPDSALRELAALRATEHPNIVKMYWYERAEGCCFLVSEYIEGRSLDNLDTVAPRQAFEIAVQVLNGLDYLHPKAERIAELKKKGRTEEMEFDELVELKTLQDRALIHRDIKPANIMLGTDGVVKIVDFNIASRAYDKRKTLSNTPGYRPPDHDVNSPTWDPDVDLFACGVVLYEMICGRSQNPYSAGPIDPREWVPDLAPSAARLLMKACAARQSDRFSSAREMADAVNAEIQRTEDAG